MNLAEVNFEHDTQWTKLVDLMVDTGMISAWACGGVCPEDEEKSREPAYKNGV